MQKASIAGTGNAQACGLSHSKLHRSDLPEHNRLVLERRQQMLARPQVSDSLRAVVQAWLGYNVLGELEPERFDPLAERPITRLRKRINTCNLLCRNGRTSIRERNDLLSVLATIN
jgi:hypothetical protein